MDDHGPEQETRPEPAGDTIRNELHPVPPVPLSRKRQLCDLAFAIAGMVEENDVRGREFCLLDSFCHRLLED